MIDPTPNVHYPTENLMDALCDVLEDTDVNIFHVPKNPNGYGIQADRAVLTVLQHLVGMKNALPYVKEKHDAALADPATVFEATIKALIEEFEL